MLLGALTNVPMGMPGLFRKTRMLTPSRYPLIEMEDLQGFGGKVPIVVALVNAIVPPCSSVAPLFRGDVLYRP